MGVGVLLAGVTAMVVPASHAASPAPTVIQVLSNRADLISGGEALVAVELPAGTTPASVRMTLGTNDITSDFALRPNGRYEGLVTGLQLGDNVVTATMPNGSGARITITNHPNGGPMFSGPQVEPWICQKTAVDAQCDEPAQFTYLYKSTDPTKMDLQAYDPAHPAADVAKTTTDNGVTVPFIVRKETGYQDRDRYRIETLYQPGQPWSPWDPQPQWDHKLLLTHGSSCHTSYGPTDPPWGNGALTGTPGMEDISTVALGRGFTVASTALDNSDADCSPVLQAESIMMAKEHITESYGELRYTVGEGCSGGSLAEQWMANAYPGLYQGLIATCTFPDADSTAQQILDYALLANYLGVPISSGASGPTLGGVVPVGTIAGELLPKRGWTTTQAAAVAGDGVANLPVSWNWGFSAYSYFQLGDPTTCPASIHAEAYNPNTNPGGVRCGVIDWQVNQLGVRQPNVWDTEEHKAGHGFAGIPVDNVGVQYGLAALEKGQISPAQFVDLNANIGGGTPDLLPAPQRVVADEPALANAYRTGLINETTYLDQLPIINLAGPNDPGLAHDSFRAFALRARLDNVHGTHANQVMWQGPAPIIGDPVRLNTTALDALDRWITAIERDQTGRSLATKVIANKPAGIVDQCSNGVGITLHDGICGSAVVPVYGTPRTVAGEPISTDQNKCQLKPLRRSDYRVTFTADQWASLEKTFPVGVCDYSKPGVDQQPTVPWLTYQNAHGGVVYGGTPMGPAPVSTPLAPSAFVSAASLARPSVANGRLAVTGGPTQTLGLVGLLLLGAAVALRSSLHSTVTETDTWSTGQRHVHP
ncbi:MAG: hypothetical protein JOZ68_01220 [Acidimicrobiia bacterium]|nr:hypothetical protein [Acidimicrobiia bacterium]